MKKIYKICINDYVVYVGQTGGYLKHRLSQHKLSNPIFKRRLFHLYIFLDIHIIERCDNSIACEREQFWITHYISKGFNLVNVQLSTPKPKGKSYKKTKQMKHIAPGIKYKTITDAQQEFIKTLGYTYLSKQLDINAETIRIATKKKIIKEEYYLKIFSTRNTNRFNKLK